MENLKIGDIVWHKVTKKKFVIEALRKNSQDIDAAIVGTEVNGMHVSDEFPLTSLTKERPVRTSVW